MLNKMSNILWISSDNKIKKNTVNSGTWGLKPTENCECTIKITECSNVDFENYSAITSFTIGNTDNKFERLLDKCIQNMNTGEIASVTFDMGNNKCYSFNLELVNFISNDLIYKWNASQKLDLALKHKNQGAKLYKESQYIDASYRFAKSLKLLCSIPIEVDEYPSEVDGVKVEKIKDLKVVLYNNLASCYLKKCDYENVLKLCEKVFEREPDNVKALYKDAIASCETQNYERSQQSFMHFLQLEPDNKTASEKLKFVNSKIAESNVRINTMIKKMFK